MCAGNRDQDASTHRLGERFSSPDHRDPQCACPLDLGVVTGQRGCHDGGADTGDMRWIMALDDRDAQPREVARDITRRIAPRDHDPAAHE